MDKFIRNEWRPSADGSHEQAQILFHNRHPEGVDVLRLRARSSATRNLDAGVGHLVSVTQGKMRLAWQEQSLQLGVGTHLYLPQGVQVELSSGFEGVLVSAGTAEQSRGTEAIVRDEEFLRGCAKGVSYRWILTGQYLSRRVFLHHDKTLTSASGDPVSWFRTTMFDVTGLPANEHGIPVFKMSYNYRTEPNVCYDVTGKLRVRMARHPYSDEEQEWGPWRDLRSDDTYHLNETRGGAEEETGPGGSKLRNRHEVSMVGGNATLFCLFDPAPTGTEEHQPGAYSDYGPLSEVLGSERYARHLEAIAPYDQMLDALSWAKAGGAQSAQHDEFLELWSEGCAEQRRIEQELLDTLGGSPERLEIVQPWSVASPG